MRWFRAQYLAKEEDALDWRVSPIRVARWPASRRPLVITAGFDPLRDGARPTLSAARGRRERGRGLLGGMIHGFVPRAGSSHGVSARHADRPAHCASACASDYS